MSAITFTVIDIYLPIPKGDVMVIAFCLAKGKLCYLTGVLSKRDRVIMGSIDFVK